MGGSGGRSESPSGDAVRVMERSAEGLRAGVAGTAPQILPTHQKGCDRVSGRAEYSTRQRAVGWRENRGLFSIGSGKCVSTGQTLRGVHVIPHPPPARPDHGGAHPSGGGEEALPSAELRLEVRVRGAAGGCGGVGGVRTVVRDRVDLFCGLGVHADGFGSPWQITSSGRMQLGRASQSSSSSNIS
jgi:hypothetical protein